MNVADWSFSVEGPADARAKVKAILLSMARKNEDGSEYLDVEAFFADDPVVNEYPKAACVFDPEFPDTHDGKFWLGGSSYLGPPMPLLEKLSRMHPTLVFTAHSTLEHVSYERWRVVDGVAEQLETFNKNLLTDQVYDHWIKDGEESVLDKYDDPELLRLEEAAQAIVSKSASPLWTENTLEQMTGLPMDREAREARKAEDKARTDEFFRQWMKTGEIEEIS